MNNQKNKFGLSKELMEELFYIFKKYPHIKKVFIYGARAQGNFKPYDQIELCILGEEIFHDEWYEIVEDIDELYTPMGFNMLQYHKVNQGLKEAINKESVILYEKDKGYEGMNS